MINAETVENVTRKEEMYAVVNSRNIETRKPIYGEVNGNCEPVNKDFFLVPKVFCWCKKLLNYATPYSVLVLMSFLSVFVLAREMTLN